MLRTSQSSGCTCIVSDCRLLCRRPANSNDILASWLACAQRRLARRVWKLLFPACDYFWVTVFARLCYLKSKYVRQQMESWCEQLSADAVSCRVCPWVNVKSSPFDFSAKKNEKCCNINSNHDAARTANEECESFVSKYYSKQHYDSGILMVEFS